MKFSCSWPETFLAKCKKLKGMHTVYLVISLGAEESYIWKSFMHKDVSNSVTDIRGEVEMIWRHFRGFWFLCLSPQILSQVIPRFLWFSDSLLSGGWGEEAPASCRIVYWWGLKGQSHRWPVACGVTFDIGGICQDDRPSRRSLIVLDYWSVSMGLLQFA